MFIIPKRLESWTSSPKSVKIKERNPISSVTVWICSEYTFTVMAGISKEKMGAKKSKQKMSEGARVFLMLAKLRQSDSEYRMEQSKLIKEITDTRKDLNKEIRYIKEGTIVKQQDVIEEVKEASVEKKEQINEPKEMCEKVNDDDHVKLKVDPNLEVLKEIRKRATPKINTGRRQCQLKTSERSNKHCKLNLESDDKDGRMKIDKKIADITCVSGAKTTPKVVRKITIQIKS